jgi:hypothetical protein
MALNPDLKVLDLDETLRSSHLAELLPPLTTAESSSLSQTYRVAVIGNSHSGILVCRNLYDYSLFHSKCVQILNFKRRGIKYAKYLDEGIVFDSTGLKGSTAEWAREVMEGEDCDTSILQQIDTNQDEGGMYERYLPGCSHIIYAIGYTRNNLPRIFIGEEQVDEEGLEYDMHTSGFRRKKQGKGNVKGLFGCGIAFPEEIEDPEGHVEAAVGLAKFFNFAERVKGDWVGGEVVTKQDRL